MSYEQLCHYADIQARIIMRIKEENSRLREALELIALPVRPDGTWNRDRQACMELAREALK